MLQILLKIRFLKRNHMLFTIIFMFFSLIQPCYAYLDPGSGGLLIQLLLGGVAGLLAIVKLYWLSLKSKIKKIFGRDSHS